MSLSGIALYCLRAGCFAAVVCGLYAAGCRLTGKRIQGRRLLAVAYLTALVQITVLRGGVDWQRVFSGGRNLPQLVPLRTTIRELQAGAWPLTYHVVGNMVWFVPLGMLLRRRNLPKALLAGAACSTGIEVLQYLLMTGVTDVDDLIINILGTAAGWLLIRILKRG